MTCRSSDEASNKTTNRRALLRAGLGGLAAAAGLDTSARAATARPRMPVRPADAGHAAGFDWSGWAKPAPGVVTDGMACIAGASRGTVAGAPLWLFATGLEVPACPLR
jgi:hypothetical protein